MSDTSINLVSALKARKLIRNGCKAYLTYMRDMDQLEQKLEEVSIVREFLDLFLEELLDLPLEQEIEFCIDVNPSVKLISITHYKIALVELK